MIPPILSATVEIDSSLPLEEVAKRISNKICAKLPFGARENYIHDEAPAISLKSNLLGLKITLQGFGGKEGYVLIISPNELLGSVRSSVNPLLGSDMDISAYVAWLLKDIEGITAYPRGSYVAL